MSRMKFLLIFCALIPHVYVIIFIRPFTAHKSIFHISSHGRGDVIFVNCVLTLAIPFLFSCNCARPVNLGVPGAGGREGSGEGVRSLWCGPGWEEVRLAGQTHCSTDEEVSFLKKLIRIQSHGQMLDIESYFLISFLFGLLPSQRIKKRPCVNENQSAKSEIC